jgi:FkbM family methyltransferase
MNAVYLGNNRAIAKTQFGSKIFVDTRDLSLAPHLLLDGMWESWITEAVAAVVQGSVFVDAGANFGWYSLVADHAKARRILAYEPNPEIFKLLQDTMMVNGIQAELRQAAVGDREERLSLQVNIDLMGSTTLLANSAEMAKGQWAAVSPYPRVSVVRLDEELNKLFKQEPHLRAATLVLKVDVEGFEPRAILGAAETLKEHENCTAFVEYHADPSGEGKLQEMLTFFEESGYRMGRVTHEAKVTSLGRNDLSNLPDADMLCFRKIPR